jgi:integrase
LHSSFRYFTACGLDPEEVTDEVLGEFFEHRKQTTFRKITLAVRRETARAWNACIDTVEGFPIQALTVEALKSRLNGPEWESFPKGFRDEIEAYLVSLKVPHRSVSGRRWKGCKSSTITTRRREIVAAARQLVLLGVPVESLTSLRNLLEPEKMGKLLDSYWAKNGEIPNTYVIDLAWKFLAIARHTNCLTPEELEELNDMRYALEQHRKLGLTDKNLTVVRAVISGNIWSKVIRLPDLLMADAQKLRTKSPMKAAVLAQVAVAIRILTYAPVRIGNLASVSLETNLIRPDGIDGPYWLVFPAHDVKNQVDLTFPFDGNITKFIELYIRDFRPVVVRGSNTSLLFPGGKGDGKNKLASTLSDQITRKIDKELGLRITGHQFRHAAAAIILKKEQGNYELVRRILGHRNIQTTTKFYVGLETVESSKQFGAMIEEHAHKEWDRS